MNQVAVLRLSFRPSFLALCLVAGFPVMGQSQSGQMQATGTVGTYVISSFWNGQGAVQVGECIKRVRLKPPKKMPGTLGGLIIGDGCMGCSVSPVWRCERYATADTPKPLYWFVVEQKGAGAFRLRLAAAKRAIRKFCGALGKRASPLKAGHENLRGERVSHTFFGRCK